MSWAFFKRCNGEEETNFSVPHGKFVLDIQLNQQESRKLHVSSYINSVRTITLFLTDLSSEYVAQDWEELRLSQEVRYVGGLIGGGGQSGS